MPATQATESTTKRAAAAIDAPGARRFPRPPPLTAHILAMTAPPAGRPRGDSAKGRGTVTNSETTNIEITRRIEAPAEFLFAILADPATHPGLDGSGMVRAAPT